MTAAEPRRAARRVAASLALVGVAAAGAWWLGSRHVEPVYTSGQGEGRSGTVTPGASTEAGASASRPVQGLPPGGGVAALAVSPDGKRAAGAGRDGSILIWRGEGDPFEIADAHHGLPATAVEFTADGEALVSAGMDSELRVWSVAEDFALVDVLQAHEHAVTAVSASPRGGLLASAGQETRIMLWEFPSGALKAILNGHQDFVNDVAFSADGVWLASAGRDGLVLVWDVAGAQLARTLVGHTAAVNEVRFTPDGRSLVSAGADGRLIVWDLNNGLPLREIVGRQGPVTGVDLSADGALLASTGTYDDVLLWDLRSGTQVAAIDTGGTVDDVRFDAEGRLMVAGAAGVIGIWDPASGNRLAQWTLN